MTAGRVLVTRPEPGASSTADRLAGLGLDPVKLPVARAELSSSALAAALDGRWAALAVTSGNAVRALESHSEAVVAWSALPLFAVGEQTALLARRAGFERAEAAGGTSSALAARIAAAAREGALAADMPLLYCAGTTRTVEFEQALQRAAIPFAVAECYSMQSISHPPAALAQLLAEPFEAALFYSRETAVSFFRLMVSTGQMDHFRARRIVCLSDRVVTGLPVHLRSAAAAPGRPSEDAILEMLAAMRR